MAAVIPETLRLRTPIESKAQLIAELASGMKPKSQWRIGTEHEKLLFLKDSLEPVPYEGPRSVRAMLEGLRQRLGWTAVHEDGCLIGLSDPAGRRSISLEPGGQLELSGSPLETLHETCDEITRHLQHVRSVGDALGIGAIGIGASPLWELMDTPMMPMERGRLIAANRPMIGGHGLNTMLQTCTVQVNLDFSSEADMVQKLRVSLALQPVATALFANSPFHGGRPSGFLSYRSELWRDTDRTRTGMLPFVFEAGMGFERYVDYALDVPMYFILRDGKHVATPGESFRRFLEGQLPQRPGERPELRDWIVHLSTILPEVRLRRYLEMRGADCGSPEKLFALPAFWTGVLYHGPSLDAAWELVKDWSAPERQQLRDDAPRLGLDAKIHGRTVRDVARDVLAMARRGLDARGTQRPEAGFLDPLDEVVASGKTAAERLLDLHAGPWQGKLAKLFEDYSY